MGRTKASLPLPLLEWSTEEIGIDLVHSL